MGFQLPILPLPCQAQDRTVPVASVTTSTALRFRSRASLVPSGDTAIPYKKWIGPGTLSLASVAAWVAGAEVSLKHTVGVVLSRFCAAAPACPEAMYQ